MPSVSVWPFRRPAPAIESALKGESTAKAQSGLIVIHSDQFQSGLADFGYPADLSNEAKSDIAENRLAVNVVLALSKNARTDCAR
jgi:hypothetical protein